MTLHQHTFVINTPRMIHETIDCETMVIDTETGVYFNISGSGYLIMQLLEAGTTIEILTERLARYFGVDVAMLNPLIEAFISQLQTEEIISTSPQADASASELELGLSGQMPFQPPVLYKFTDMEELLLVDPIHEVEDAGWPHRAQ